MISYEICLSLSGLLSIISKSIHVAANGIISFFFNGWVVSHWEKAMETHSNTLAWKIPWTEEPGRLHSMGLRRAGHDWATSLSLFTFMHWRGKWQPTPVFLPGESQGRGSLVGCRLWGSHKVGHDWRDLAAAIFHCMSVPHLLYLFISWWTLRLLHVLATVNSAAMNIRVHEFFWMRDISEYTSRCGIVGSYIVLFLVI